MNLKNIKLLFIFVVIFICGGVTLPHFDFYRFDSNVSGEPAIYYARIALVDEFDKPISQASFSWSNHISLIQKKRSPYVIDEISDGLYIIAIVGKHNLSSLEITVNHSQFNELEFNIETLNFTKFQFGDINYKENTTKVVMDKI